MKPLPMEFAKLPVSWALLMLLPFGPGMVNGVMVQGSAPWTPDLQAASQSPAMAEDAEEQGAAYADEGFSQQVMPPMMEMRPEPSQLQFQPQQQPQTRQESQQAAVFEQQQQQRSFQLQQQPFQRAQQQRQQRRQSMPQLQLLQQREYQQMQQMQQLQQQLQEVQRQQQQMQQQQMQQPQQMTQQQPQQQPQQLPQQRFGRRDRAERQYEAMQQPPQQPAQQQIQRSEVQSRSLLQQTSDQPPPPLAQQQLPQPQAWSPMLAQQQRPFVAASAAGGRGGPEVLLQQQVGQADSAQMPVQVQQGSWPSFWQSLWQRPTSQLQAQQQAPAQLPQPQADVNPASITDALRLFGQESGSCFPGCVEGQGYCDGGMCFCRMPYAGPQCEKRVEDKVVRVGYLTASLVMTLSVLVGIGCGMFIAKRRQAASKFDMNNAVEEAGPRPEVWRVRNSS